MIIKLLFIMLIPSCAGMNLERLEHGLTESKKESRSIGSKEDHDEDEKKHSQKGKLKKKKFGSAHEEFEETSHSSSESTVNELQEHEDEDSDFASLHKEVASGLRAGYTDDSKQFVNFLKYLDKYKADATHYDFKIKERIIINIKDKGGRPIINASVKVYANNILLAEGKTYSNSIFNFYPTQFDSKFTEYKIVASKGKEVFELKIPRKGKRNYTIKLDYDNKHLPNIPVDVAFILDTTGSMSEEIKQLRESIEIINLNLSQITKSPIRFGLVLFKDLKDDYTTKHVQFSSNLANFKTELAKVEAKGGGDVREDLQSALKVTLKDLSWNPEAIKVAYIITDAGPHLDYSQDYTYIHAGKDAVKSGIKLFSIGAGGLDINGEYVLRQLSQYTDAKYIYLAKKEGDHSSPGEEEHHEGGATHFDRLESIVIRFTKEEINNAKAKFGEESENLIIAKVVKGESKEDIISDLFDFAIKQLIDFSTVPIDHDSIASTLPVSFDSETLKPTSEYLGEQLLESSVRLNKFKVINKKELKKVLDEWSLKQSLGIDDNAYKFGKLLGAKFLINSKLYKTDKNFELFLKLLDVETGEVLSVTKLQIDKTIGL